MLSANGRPDLPGFGVTTVYVLISSGENSGRMKVSVGEWSRRRVKEFHALRRNSIDGTSVHPIAEYVCFRHLRLYREKYGYII